MDVDATGRKKGGNGRGGCGLHSDNVISKSWRLCPQRFISHVHGDGNIAGGGRKPAESNQLIPLTLRFTELLVKCHLTSQLALVDPQSLRSCRLVRDHRHYNVDYYDADVLQIFTRLRILTCDIKAIGSNEPLKITLGHQLPNHTRHR